MVCYITGKKLEGTSVQSLRGAGSEGASEHGAVLRVPSLGDGWGGEDQQWNDLDSSQVLSQTGLL